MKRGEIYYIQNNWQEVGCEQRAGRPAVIVSNNTANNCSEVVEIVYLTTKPKTDLPTHVLTRSTGQPSTILCEQIHTVSTLRIGDYVGTLSEKELQELDISLAISLGIDLGTVQIMREPTEEELEKIREVMRREMRVTIEPQRAEPTIAENPDKTKAKKLKVVPNAQEIKTKTERDLYKKFSEDLLEILKGGVKE